MEPEAVKYIENAIERERERERERIVE